MITTTVVGKVKAPDGTVVEGAEILARLNGFDYDEEFGYITSRRISTTTDANGEFSFELWPNTRGTEGSIYRIVINSPINGVSTNFTATIPEQAEVELNDAADFSPVPPLSDAEQLVNDAKAFKDKAKAFATEAEDVEVEPGLFSALHYSTKADDSASAAAASESNAATSESNASSSASAAATSESNAATSESNAATSESNAQDAETAAVSAKDDAVAAKNATENIFDTFDDRFLGAFSSAPTTDNDGNPIVAGAVYYDTTQQEVYFYNGATWDSPAAQAETSATNALASENAAATSESNASDSETNAANSASAAATSETNAQTSAQNAADSFDSFDDRYLGSKSSEPTTDNDGDPLLEGALYYDSGSGSLRFYDGAAWNTIATRSDAEIRALFSAGGDLSYNNSTGEFSVTVPAGYDSTDFDTDFGNKTTTDLTEGSNLYYTDARVNADIDGRVDKAFVDALNVDSDTLDGQDGSHYLDRANHTGTQSLSTISDSGALASLDSLDSSDIAYDNTTSGLSATDAQAAIDETADETGLALIQDGVDPAVARAVAYNDIGAPVAGGYFAGVIDTITGTIIAADDYQTGQRYALIVAPKELEGGRDSSPAAGLTTGDLQWDTARGSGEAGTFTRWNGLDATNVIINKNDARYEVHNFIEEVRNNYEPAPTPGGSTWYLPAMDELELLYRNFKPNYADNRTDTRTRNFPGSQPSGFNPSSDPTGSNYSNSPRVPEKTPIIGFRDTETAAIDLKRYWSTTDADEDGRVWEQFFTFSGIEGFQGTKSKDDTSPSVRPVRRVLLS